MFYMISPSYFPDLTSYSIHSTSNIFFQFFKYTRSSPREGEKQFCITRSLMVTPGLDKKAQPHFSLFPLDYKPWK